MLSENVLCALENSKGEIVTGGEIARKFGVSRNAVWKAVAALREQGHDIESVPNSGYRLSSFSDGLSISAITSRLSTEMLGRSVELLKTVDSTNTYLKAQDTARFPHGHTVIADGQTAGRGRLGRSFSAPPQSGVYLSCLLKPDIPLSETPFLTICAAVAVCRAVESVCGAKALVKWVNDIFLNGKKLCGILTEAGVNAEMQAVDYAVVGIGVNTGEISTEIEDVATSIFKETGLRGIRNALASEILNRFEAVYADFLSGKKPEILNEYRERLFIIGQKVSVIGGGGEFEATALGVDDSGSLLVECNSGETLTVTSGEVSIKIKS